MFVSSDQSIGRNCPQCIVLSQAFRSCVDSFPGWTRSDCNKEQLGMEREGMADKTSSWNVYLPCTRAPWGVGQIELQSSQEPASAGTLIFSLLSLATLQGIPKLRLELEKHNWSFGMPGDSYMEKSFSFTESSVPHFEG